MSAVFFLPLVNAFLLIPAQMAFAKCVPHQIEGIMLGMIGTIVKLNSDIIMRLVSLLFLIKSGVTSEDYEYLSSRMYWAAPVTCLAMFFLPFIFHRHEFAALQAVIHKMETMTPEEIDAMNVELKTKHKQKQKLRR